MTTKEKQQRNILLLLPLMLAPLAALLFYGFGGGKGSGESQAVLQHGLNTTLPGRLTDNHLPPDKLSIYQQADKDSVKRRELLNRDPFFQQQAASVPEVGGAYYGSKRAVIQPLFTGNRADASEQALQQKLAALETVLQAQPATIARTDTARIPRSAELEALLRHSTTPPPITEEPATPDPELDQLNAMLEKVLDIQYPQRIQEKNAISTQPPEVAPIPIQEVTAQPIPELLLPDTLNADAESIINRFYAIETPEEASPAGTAIPALIHPTQRVVSGATVKLRLQQDMSVQGHLIPAGTFIFGQGKLSGDRYQISLTHLSYQQQIMPVALEVFSYDGQRGIPIAGAISRKIAKQEADQGLQGLQVGSLDPSIRAQAATAGIETVKALLSHKVRLVSLTLKAGYPVLLRNTNTPL